MIHHITFHLIFSFGDLSKGIYGFFEETFYWAPVGFEARYICSFYVCITCGAKQSIRPPCVGADYDKTLLAAVSSFTKMVLFDILSLFQKCDLFLCPFAKAVPYPPF